MADNNDIITGGNPIDVSSYVPGPNTYLNYGPNLYPVPDLPKYEDYPIPSGPPQNFKDPFLDVNNQFNRDINAALSLRDYKKQGNIDYFPAESLNFDRYVDPEGAWAFGDTTGGFVPWRDNEATHNASTNFLKEMYRSTSWAAPLYWDGFTSGLRSFPDLIDGVFTGDWDSFLSSDDAVAEKWSRATKMGSSTYGPASSFFTNFEISAAHMLGTVTEIVAENALLAFVEGASFGGATPAVAARFSMNMGRGFRALSQAYRNLSKVGDIFSDANAARKVFYNAAKLGGNTLKFFSPLRNTTDLVRGVYSGSETFNAVRAFGAAYRDLREVNFALSEAKLEGGFQKLQLKDDLTRDYVNQYGRLPEGDNALRIQQAADASADFTTKFNLPVIYYSNRIGFGNLFRGNGTISNLMRGAASNSVFNSIKFNTGKQLFEAVSPYNVKNAFRYGLGNSLNYFKANYMEGIQENLQETIGGASYDYYYKRFYNPSYGGMNAMLGDLSKNLGNQFSGQGLSTFLSGALMGTIPAGGVAAARGVQDLAFRYTNKEKYQEFQAKRKDLVNKYVNQLNEVYKDPLKFFDPELMNAVRQAELGKYLTQSSINQNDKNFHDVKDQAVYEHLMTVLRSGKIDLFRDKINNFKQLEGDELTAAIGFNVEDAGKLKERLDQTLGRLDKLEERYNDQQDKLPNPINLTAFKQGTKEYEDAAIKFMAWENAREQAIFMGYSFDRTAERMVDLLGRFKNIKKTSKGNYIDLAMVTNPDLYNNEIKLLQDEIASLKQGDEDSKKLAALKEQRLGALKKWKNAVESPGGDPLTVKVQSPAITPDGGIYPVDYPTAANPAYENYRNLAKLAFERLVEVEASAVKDSAFREGVDEGFDILMDFLQLSKEQGRLTEAINTLADPENFLKLYEGHYGVMKDIFNRRSQIIIEAIEKGLKITDSNDLIHKLLRLKHPEQTNGVDTFGYVEDPQNPGKYYKIVNDQIIPVEPGSKDYDVIKQVVDEHNKATETETRKREEAKAKAAKEAADRAKAASEKPKETAQDAVVSKGDVQGTYSPNQSYYNGAHKIAPKEVEYTINYNPNGSIKSIVWNYKGATGPKNVEKSISTESEFKQLIDLYVAKTYFQSLLTGKMNKSNMKYDKKEDMHTGFIDSILTNKDAFGIVLNLSPDVEQELFNNIDLEGLDKQNYEALSRSIANILKGIVADIDKQIADKQKAFTATKQTSDPKFLSVADNTLKVFSTPETDAEMRAAVLGRTPDSITSNATLKVVRTLVSTEPKVVFTKNNGAYKVLRQNPPISSELYIDGKLVGYPTYHNVYTFEINGVVKTVDQLTKTEYSIFAKPEAGTYEDFLNNYLGSKAVYEAINLKLGDKESVELSSEELKKIMALTPKQGDYVFTDEEHQLVDLEAATNSVMIAVVDKKSPTEPILRGATATEINENRAKLNTLLGRVDFAEKTKNQGRYIAVFALPNGNPALVEVSSGYLASEEKDELFADIKTELENTFKKNVEVKDGKRIAKNPEFTRDFDESLSQRVFIAVPASTSSLGYGVKISLTAAGDLKLNFDNYKDRNFTVFVDIPYDKSNKALIKGFDDLLSRINQSVVAFNSANPAAELPTIKSDYFKNSIPANTNFTQISGFFTNVDPSIFKNTSIRFTPNSDLVKDVMPVPVKKTVKFPRVQQEGAVAVREEVDPSTVDAEDMKGAKKKTASTKQAVLQPNQSPLAQVTGTARTEPVVTEAASTTPTSVKLSDIKAKYDTLKAELAAKYTDASGNITDIVKYNEELSKITKDEENEKAKLAAQRKKPILKVSDKQYYDEQDIIDLAQFKNWMDNNMPDIFTQEEMDTVMENLTNNKVVLGRFVSYVKTMSDDSRRVVGVIQTSPSVQFAYHEAFHGIFRLLLTDAQIDKMLSLGKYQLIQQLKKKGMTFDSRLAKFKQEHPSYLELTDKELEDRLVEEYLADEFDTFKLNRKGTTPKQGDENFIKRIFNKIREFISRLLNRSYGIQQLFEQIDRGKFKSANVQNNRFTRELSDIPYVEVYKIAYGYDVIADTQGNEISVKKYLSESDTNRIVSSVVNSFLQRIETMKEFNKNSVLESILNDYQQLYQFGKYADQKMTVEKNARLRTFNQVFTNPEAREDIKRNANVFLNLLGFEQELDDDQFDALLDDVGDREMAGQYGDSFGQGGYKSLSKYLRLYIQSTVKEQGDEFGNTVLNPETDEKVYMGVNAGVVYNGLIKVMSGVTTSDKFIRRLLSFRTGNSDSSAFIDKFIQDTGLEMNEETGEWGITQNPRLFNSVFKAFTLFRVDYEDLIIDPKKKVAFFVRSNAKDAASNQYNRWQSDFEFYYQDQLTSQKKKTAVETLARLNDPLRSNISVTDDELQALAEDLRLLQKVTGISISPVYYSYSVAKALQARKMELSAKMQDLVVAYDGVVPISPDDFTAIIKTLNENNNPFISFDDFVKQQSFDEDQMFDDEAEADAELEEDKIGDDEAAKLAEDLERIAKIGNKSRLMRIAENNAIFDETVLSTSFENAEGESVTSHQYPTFHLAYLEDIIKNRSEILKKIESDPHIADSYLGKQIMENGDLSKILNRLKITRMGGLRQISAIVTKDGKIVEDKRRQVNRREGVVYGKFGDRELITALLSQYLLKEEQVAVANPEAKSGYDYITTTRHLIRVIESKNTGDTINLPVIKSVYGKGKETKLTEEAKKALMDEFLSEYNRITRVANEDNLDNVISDYNDAANPNSKMRGLKLRNFAAVLGDRAEYYERKARGGNPTLTQEEMNEIDYIIERFYLGDAETPGLVDQFINAMVASGVVSTQTSKEGKITYVNEMLPLEVFSKKAGKPTSRMTRLNLVGDFRANIAQIFINDHINTMSFNKLYYGDQSATLKDFIDSVKRAAGSNAQGYNMYSDVLAPELGITHMFKNSDVTIHADPTYASKHGGDPKQKSADAQTWTTVKAFRYNQFALGRLDTFKASILDKIDQGLPLTSEEIFGINGTIRNNAQLKVEKIVYDDGRMYIKTSAFALTKEFTSVLTPEAKARIAALEGKEDQIRAIRLDNANWQARPNMVDLHNKRVALETKEQRSNTVAYSIPESAAKMLRINVSESTTDFNVDDSRYYTLDNRYMRLQVENSTNKNKITDSTQGMQIIDTEQIGSTSVQFRGVNSNVKTVSDIYQKSVAQKVQVSYVNARNSIFDMGSMRNQFTISVEEGKITPELGKFQKRAIETLKKTGASSQLIDFFDVIEDPETGELTPRYDLNHPYTANKYEELFLAYFRRGVLSQQVPGHALTLVSGFGMKKIKRARIVKDGVPLAWDVISDSDYEANPERFGVIKEVTDAIQEGDYFLDELRHNVRTYDSNGNLLKDVPAYAEFMMPAHFREFMDLKPGEKLPEEILKAFAARTPGQDLHSLTNLKLVDFMPAYYGSSGVFAKEVVEIMGADFDVDKLYTQIADFYTKNVVNRETGKVEKKIIAYGYSKEDNFLEYIIWNAKNNAGLKDYIAELKEKDPRYERINALMDNIHTLRSKIYNERESLKDFLEDLKDSNWLLGTVATDPSYDFTITLDPEVIDTDEYMKMRSEGAESIRTRIMNLDQNITDAITEIKKSGAKAFYLTEKLRNLRFEKQAIDQFILFEAMEYMKMPITRQAFELQTKKRGEINIGRLNNLILDSKYALLGNSGVVDTGIAFEPANEGPLEVLETDPDLIAGVRQEINLDNDHLLGKTVAYRNNKEGQKNVGSAVNAMMSYTLAHKMGLEVREKIKEINGKDVDFIYKLEIDGVPFNNYKNTRTAVIENGVVTKKFSGRRIMNVISALITAMTDNAKNRRAAKLNLNINAVGFVADLVGRGVPEKLAVAMILNPAVKEYYARTAEKKYKIQTKRLDTKLGIAISILKNLEAKAGLKPNEGEMKPLTTKSILDAINNPSDAANLFSVFSHFLKLEEQNYPFSSIAQLMKMVKGPGTELVEWDALEFNAYRNLGVGMSDEDFDKSNLPYDLRPAVDGGNKIMTAYWDINTQLYNELAKTMFISRSKIFRQVFKASKDQFNVPFFLEDVFNAKMKSNLTLFFGMKAYLKSLRDRGDELASLLTNNLVYNTEDGAEDIVKMVNYGRSILPNNYLLNKYINAIPQGKMQGGKLILNKDNKKGISHLNPSSWGKLDAFQLEKLQNSFVELYADERTRRVALALFAYTAVKDGTLYRADGLMRVFPPFMFDELMGDIMFNVRNLFSQDTLERYEEDGDKYEAFQQLFATDFKGVVEEFIKMYSTHVTNKFYVKKVLIGEAEDGDVGKPIRYARKQNGEIDNSTVIFDLFVDVRNLVVTKEFIQGEMVDVLTRPTGKLSGTEKNRLISNIKALINRGFKIKEITPGSNKLGVILPYIIKTSDKNFYVLQNMSNVKTKDEMEEVPLAQMFNKDYEFVGAKAVYKKINLKGVNAQIPIAELFGEVPTAEQQRKYWRGINLEEMGTRAFPKGRATITDESGVVINLDTYDDIQQGVMTDTAMEPTEYAEGVTSPDTTIEAVVEPEDVVAPVESTKTIKTQLEDLGYKVNVVDKVVLITKDGKQQNRKGETAQKFLDRIKPAAAPIAEPGKKKAKFPKLTDEQIKKMQETRDKLDKGDFDADEIIKC